MMKPILLYFLFFLCIYTTTYCQVGINTTDPNANLDVRSSSLTNPSPTDGILIPKIDVFPTTNPMATQDGMLVYVTGNGSIAKGFYFWDNTNTTWNTIGGALEKLDEGNGPGWRLQGINPNNYGSIGDGAVDLSTSLILSTTNGATGDYSFTTGRRNTASGMVSTAMGGVSIASGYGSFAVSGQASGDNAVAFMSGEASGYQSLAFGPSSISSGELSFAFGHLSRATDFGAFAIGQSTFAHGRLSVSMGQFNFANGNYSLTHGYSLVSESFGQITLGLFSTRSIGDTDNYVATDRLFVLGNGTNTSNQSDALTVLKNGTITAPSFDITEITDNKALITKEYADATYAAGTVENPQTPTLILNWEAYGGGYIDPRFYKNNERVYLQGLLRKTVAFVTGELIFTLPIGYRPSGRVLATGGQSGNTVRVDILSNGEVRYMSGGNGSDFISLEGISFRAN